MCLGSKIQSPSPLAHNATGLTLLLPEPVSAWGQSHRGRTEPPPGSGPPGTRGPARASLWERCPGILLQLLCALLAADLRLILNFNLSDFIFKPSVLIIPLSAKLKSPLIPSSFLPGKVLAHCNQVTSQATFR